jgi:FAD/FMN-containing dehydrogenase
MDGDAFLAELRSMLGERGVLTDAGAMAPYLEDWRGLARGTAIAVARPERTAEVADLVRLCARTGTAVVPQGGVTGLVNASAPHGPRPVLVLSLDRTNRVLEVDTVNLTLTAEAGCILQEAQQAAAAEGLRLPLRIGAEGSARLGGVLATNAGGNLTIRYGNTRELCLGLEVVLPDGRVLDELKRLRKDNTGYDLKHLFIGAEGTLGVITRATLKLVPAPIQSAVVLLALADLDGLFDLLGRFRREVGDHLSVFELLPRLALDLVTAHMPGARDPLAARADWYVLVEVESAQHRPDLDEVVGELLADAMAAELITDGVVAQSETQAAELRKLREQVSEAQRAEGFGLRHDVAVPVDRLVDFVRTGSAMVAEIVPAGRIVAFGHVGDGNVHFNVQSPAGDPEAAGLRAAGDHLTERVHDLAVEMGGTFSAEHGVGRLKRATFARHRPLKHELGRALKRWLDPTGIMNPGVVFEDD